MSRYIDIEPYEKDGWYLQKTYHNEYCEVVKTTPLISVPTAEPNSCEYWDSESRFCALRRPQAEFVKHGKWNTVVNSNNHITYYCPICGSIFNKGCADLGDYNYCPNCGAKMDLDEVDNG
jgi:predicted RNA-binding Zn-ribbon protein involved in translation (DUF1610 family)